MASEDVPLSAFSAASNGYYEAVRSHRASWVVAITAAVGAAALLVAAILQRSGGLGVGCGVLAVIAWRALDYSTDDRDLTKTEDGRLVARPSTAWLFGRKKRGL